MLFSFKGTGTGRYQTWSGMTDFSHHIFLWRVERKACEYAQNLLLEIEMGVVFPVSGRSSQPHTGMSKISAGTSLCRPFHGFYFLHFFCIRTEDGYAKQFRAAEHSVLWDQMFPWITLQVSYVLDLKCQQYSKALIYSSNVNFVELGKGAYYELFPRLMCCSYSLAALLFQQEFLPLSSGCQVCIDEQRAVCMYFLIMMSSFECSAGRHGGSVGSSTSHGQPRDDYSLSVLPPVSPGRRQQKWLVDAAWLENVRKVFKSFVH